VAPAEGATDQILFYDFPGSEPKSWRAAYENLDRRSSRIFSHLFIHEDESAPTSARYQLVFQFWFFYPFNDAVNEHEGDWEHINVIVTPHAFRERGSIPLPITQSPLVDSLELTGMLRGDSAITDSLAIGAVDYYFLQNVVRLNYMTLSTG